VKVLFLASAGGASMRRSLRSAIAVAAPLYELRMLAPDAEAKALRDCGVPTESWRPAGLFNVLRAINVLRRAVDRYEPDAIHAFGWTAAAVALGALPTRYARRTLVTLQDPIRKNEMPKAFIEKRLPELLARSWSVECAYETLRRVLVDTLNVPGEKVRLVPYGVAPLVPDAFARPVGRPGPIVGYAGRLESDRAWEIIVDALARARKLLPDARLSFGRTGPIAGLVRSHARTNGVFDAVTFHDDLEMSELFTGIDMLAMPSTFDGLPYAFVEALVSGVPVIGPDTGGVADTLAPYAGWLVPDDAAGFAAGISEAWSEIDRAWEAAQTQRARTTEVFSASERARELLATYARMAAEPMAGLAPLAG
jgi:glycosyltransferase involved in cell wall biosynthesis